MNIKSNKSNHPIKTAMAILDGDCEWLFDFTHPEFNRHRDNLEYLALKGAIFKNSKGNYFFTRLDLEFYVNHNGLTMKEKFERDALRTSILATVISFISLLISILTFWFGKS